MSSVPRRREIPTPRLISAEVRIPVILQHPSAPVTLMDSKDYFDAREGQVSREARPAPLYPTDEQIETARQKTAEEQARELDAFFAEGDIQGFDLILLTIARDSVEAVYRMAFYLDSPKASARTMIKLHQWGLLKREPA